MERPPIRQQVTFLHTADLEKTADFYENILGLPLVLDQGTCRIYGTDARQTAFLGFCRHLEPPTIGNSVILTLVSPAVDQWADYLSAQGIELEKPPVYNADYDIYHCFLRDPNNYLIEIQHFHDPAWPVRQEPGPKAP